MEWIDMVISISFNNMLIALHCIESNFSSIFHQFCGMLIKRELQYMSLLNIFECN